MSVRPYWVSCVCQVGILRAGVIVSTAGFSSFCLITYCLKWHSCSSFVKLNSILSSVFSLISLTAGPSLETTRDYLCLNGTWQDHILSSLINSNREETV
ncbi:hypothetical protein H0X48_06940 [Candidatus Dependentiae bacterium]|nr:hypothetical protein [Candidatus Dependentiae bacterium]